MHFGEELLRTEAISNSYMLNRMLRLVIAWYLLLSLHATVSADPVRYTSQGMSFVLVNPTGTQAYGIGAYEVTVSEYVTFLNSVASSNLYDLYGGKSSLIARQGTSGSYQYASQPFKENLPVQGVHWYQAARFANWMTNGRAAGDTESGAYSLNGLSQSVTSREAGAIFGIPTSEEWAEAAYGTGDGLPSNYWLYATQSNDLPRATIVSFGNGDAAGIGNSANYNNGDGSSGKAVASVGTSGGPSGYGAFDMSGNVSEIVDLPSGPYASSWDYRWPTRGGDWANSAASMTSSTPIYLSSFGSGSGTLEGFRLVTAIVPEPTTAAMATAGILLLVLRWVRMTRRSHTKGVRVSFTATPEGVAFLSA